MVFAVLFGLARGTTSLHDALNSLLNDIPWDCVDNLPFEVAAWFVLPVDEPIATSPSVAAPSRTTGGTLTTISSPSFSPNLEPTIHPPSLSPNHLNIGVLQGFADLVASVAASGNIPSAFPQEVLAVVALGALGISLDESAIQQIVGRIIPDHPDLNSGPTILLPSDDSLALLGGIDEVHGHPPVDEVLALPSPAGDEEPILLGGIDEVHGHPPVDEVLALPSPTGDEEPILLGGIDEVHGHPPVDEVLALPPPTGDEEPTPLGGIDEVDGHPPVDEVLALPPPTGDEEPTPLRGFERAPKAPLRTTVHDIQAALSQMTDLDEPLDPLDTFSDPMSELSEPEDEIIDIDIDEELLAMITSDSDTTSPSSPSIPARSERSESPEIPSSNDRLSEEAKSKPPTRTQKRPLKRTYTKRPSLRKEAAESPEPVSDDEDEGSDELDTGSPPAKKARMYSPNEDARGGVYLRTADMSQVGNTPDTAIVIGVINVRLPSKPHFRPRSQA
jgi:hypothetical protein